MATDPRTVLTLLSENQDSLIRPFDFDDLPEVYDIENRSMPFGWSKQIFKSCLVGPYESWKMEIVGLKDSRIVGYYVLYVMKTFAELCNICVDVSEQQKGFGTLLLNHAVQRCAERGIRTLSLEVRQSNVIAKKLYLDFGFRSVGVRKNYYAAIIGREDAEVMELPIA